MTSMLLAAALAADVRVAPDDDLAALTSSLGPDDDVIFTAGTYELEATLTITAEGAEGQPVGMFPSADAEGPVILKAMGPFQVFELRDSAYVNVRNLVFEGPDTFEEDGNNIVSLRDSSHITFTDNILRNAENTLLVLAGDGSDYLIENNLLEVSWNGHGIYAGCGDGSCWLSDSRIVGNQIRDIVSENTQFGIILDNGAQNNRIENNTIYNVTAHGVRVESTQFGDPNWVEGNAIWAGTGDGIQVYGRSRVRNNVVFEMEGHGIRSGNHENDDLEDAVISYNTIALTDEWGVRLDDWADRPGMVFSSNVVANITGLGFYYDSDLDDEDPQTDNYITHNVVSGYVDNVDTTVFTEWYVPGSGVADFEDVIAWDFYPVSSSDLVGSADPAGDAWIPEVDFNGSPRNGAAPTVGAYEWDGSGNPGWVIQEDFKDLDATSRGPGGTQVSGGCCGSKDDPADAWMLLPLLALGLKRRRAS